MLALMYAVGVLAAPDYLTEVRSDPITAEGSPPEIASRGEACMARLLGSGRVGGELIISRDHSAGIVVARNALTYQDGWILRWEMRSRVTLEARDGRFRITHTNIERLNEQAGGWTPVGKWRGSGWQKAEEALKGQTEQLAACITSAAAQDDW